MSDPLVQTVAESLRWMERNFWELIGVIFMPVLLMYLRKRWNAPSRIGQTLSADEAAFRADLMNRIDMITERADTARADFLECEKKHLQAEMRIAHLESEIASLRAKIY